MDKRLWTCIWSPPTPNIFDHRIPVFQGHPAGTGSTDSGGHSSYRSTLQPSQGRGHTAVSLGTHISHLLWGQLDEMGILITEWGGRDEKTKLRPDIADLVRESWCSTFRPRVEKKSVRKNSTVETQPRVCLLTLFHIFLISLKHVTFFLSLIVLFYCKELLFWVLLREKGRPRADAGSLGRRLPVALASRPSPELRWGG